MARIRPAGPDEIKFTIAVLQYGAVDRPVVVRRRNLAYQLKRMTLKRGA
jgi:hypothetical protein